jgi:hypothetical protein
MKPSDFTRVLKLFGFAKTPRVGYNNPYFFSAIGVILAHRYSEHKSCAKEVNSRQHKCEQQTIELGSTRVQIAGVTTRPMAAGLYWKGQRDGNSF